LLHDDLLFRPRHSGVLYAHLSEIGVSAGQAVAQGESLGRSGMTGLAAGDHLHFAMLIHGTYTNPIDWFDAKYIADRISGPLLEAGLSLPGLTDITAPAKSAKPAKKQSRRR
jgi:murein DD-endopeptidase MepM/ murein hydrolase activator NlpD